MAQSWIQDGDNVTSVDASTHGLDSSLHHVRSGKSDGMMSPLSRTVWSLDTQEMITE